MTLFKQLYLATAIAFLVILATTETIFIRNAHKYLQEQLASHAQDAATSLGLVLPASMAENDLVRIEVTVNALFDRGYYQSIRVVDINGETLVLKTFQDNSMDAPQWFVKALPLQAPSAESLISKGWKQLGRVVITSHPNFAYKQLWRTLQEASMNLAILYMLSMMALHSFLTRILKPLHAIEKVANALSSRDFQTIKSIPRVRELRNVVNAINSMSIMLRKIVEFEVSQAVHFRDESSKDALTGLENRRGFEAYLGSLLDGGQNLNSGVMYMFQIIDFQGYNIRHNFQQGDALLKEISDALRSVSPEKDFLRSRLNGATFAVMVPNISREEALKLGNSFSEALNGIVGALQDDPPLSIGCGGVYFLNQTVTISALLGQSDMAMNRTPCIRGCQFALQNLSDDDQNKGSLYWKHLIKDAISAQRITLLSQTVMNIGKDEILQVEVLARLKNQHGKLVSANQFIPMANRHRLTPALDLAILKQLFKKMSSGIIADAEVAINLSVFSLDDSKLLDWLTNAMKLDTVLSRRLVFEFTEFGLVQNKVGVEKFVAMIRSLGANFAVDNFGLHQNAFEYLQRLKPHYVKLSPAYIRDLEVNEPHQFFISSVVIITRPLQIRVIALGVEDIKMLKLLSSLGVDGYQGFVTGKMSELGGTL